MMRKLIDKGMPLAMFVGGLAIMAAAITGSLLDVNNMSFYLVLTIPCLLMLPYIFFSRPKD